jgi:hypothetical protein
MRAVPAHVVGLWAIGNAALALGILAYGGGPFPVLLHLGGSALVAAFGVAVLVSWRRRGVGPQLRTAYRSIAALAAGILGLLLALTWVYGPWVLALAPYPALVVVVMVRRERLPADVSDVDHPREVPVERPTTTHEVREEALEIAHARKRRRRGEAT